jgi:hypothetical protein
VSVFQVFFSSLTIFTRCDKVVTSSREALVFFFLLLSFSGSLFENRSCRMCHPTKPSGSNFFLTILVEPKPTSSIPSHSSRTKPTSSIPSHSSQAKTLFHHSRPFHSGQNPLLPLQAIPVGQTITSSIPSGAIPVGPKPTSSIPRHSSQAKTHFLHSKTFQAVQNRFPPFQAISVEPKPTSSIPSYFS